ncbi:DMT family transporter [Paenibacillus sp. J5C_2022]|uniref:DMT family transporter n=1 Tax=Paenibacillus sp. J5C2022 TaxID=2977129 RepID=UPI0021CEA9EA|nr:DMT family transporter [Paenibacillus sp. J5C2022]MCU6708398.1 DMT family transporter [Paenibacillus sp. J5C2022]
MKGKAEQFFSSKFGVVVGATTATLLWGSAFPFVKIGYGQLDIHRDEVFEQILFAGYRFLLAAVLIMVMMKLFRIKEVRSLQNVRTVIAVSIFQTGLQYLFFYIGLSASSGMNGSIIAGTTSFFQMLLAHFMYKNERLDRSKYAGLTLGMAGIAMVSLSAGSYMFSFGYGEMLLLLAMFCGALGNILSREGAQRMDVFYLTSRQMLFGSLALIGIGASQTGLLPFTFTLQSAAVLLYLAMLSAAGFILWNFIMKYNQVGKVSMYLFLIPVFGVILSNVLLSETLRWITLVSLALVAAGIVMVNGERRPTRKPQRGPLIEDRHKSGL